MTIKPFLVILERFMRFQDVNVADLIASAIVTGDRSQKRERQGGAEQERPFEGISPLVLAALMARREEREGISPLLLATLVARRRGREEGEGIAHPLVLAALMARREEREKETV